MRKRILSLLVPFFLTLPAAQAALIFPTASSWKFLKGTAEASSPDTTAWRATNFNDSAFVSSPAPFWYGDPYPGGTQLTDMLTNYTCIFLRKTFAITNLSDISALKLGAFVDDGFVAWINGVEVQRVNMPAGEVTRTTLANNAIEPVPFVVYDLLNPASYLVEGMNVIAVQVFNTALTSSDLGFDVSLTTVAPDFVAPAIANVTPAPGTITTLVQIAVTFTEPVSGIDAPDLLVNGQPAVSVNGSDSTYTFTFSQPAYGAVQIAWTTGHGIADFGFPPNAFDATAPGASWQYNLVDTTPPMIVNTIPAPNTIVTRLNQIEVFFSEPVSGVNAGDLLINGVPATGLTFGVGGQFVFSFPEPPTGAVQVAWSASHRIQDLSSVPNSFGGGEWTYLLDPHSVPPNLIISEFMAANLNYTNDVNGDPSDWIEIYNSSDAGVNLDGWYLTDTTNTLTKWRFPNVALLPNSYLLVWASEKNRTNPLAQLHTNFKLEKNGEYLALLRPDLSVASEFAPIYPPQQNNISYGRDRVSPDIAGFYQAPTPGKANTTLAPGLASEVNFSRPSGTFSVNNPFLVTLRMINPNSNAVIRYTVNGSAVTATSPLYSAPILVSSTVQLRARAFEPGLLPGPPQTGIYIALNANALGFTSDLPLLIFHNHGAGAVPASGEQYVSTMVFEVKNGYSSLTNAPDLVTRGRFRLRGSSTEGYAKGSFAYEAWDEFNDDRDISFLGMPEDSDWVFYAPNNFEPALIHNPLAYEMSRQIGRYASRTRFAEVFLNIAGGAIDTPTPSSGNYNGIYAIEEKMKIGKHRVDLDEMGPQHTNPPEVTGGYLMKQDRTDPGDSGFRGPQPANTGSPDQPLLWVDPKEPEILLPQRDPQEQYIKNYLTNFVNALSGANYTNPISGYAPWIDTDSWIDHSLHNVVTFNVDALRLSGYFYKPRNAPMNMGPVWDFDRTQGSTDGRDANPRVWANSGGTDFFNYPWWRRLFTDPDFFQKWIDRYQQLRAGAFSTNNLFNIIDTLANQVRAAQPREQTRWGISPRGATGSGAGTYATEIQWKKNWYASRLEFIDTNFLAKPVFSTNAGPIPSGYPLTITGPAKPGTIIYYSLNGTDPRLPGGGISPAAAAYSGPITLTANARVVARSYNATHRNLTGTLNPPISSPWSGPSAATFVVSTPPLRITEIMYHPQDPPLGGTNNDEDFEYIELRNISASPLNLIGFSITNGIQYTFSGGSSVTSLVAGGTVLLVKNRAAFLSRYPAVTNIAGEYAENLDNDGDQLYLEGPLKEPILNFAYEDDWYPITDGFGFSLVIINDNAPLNTWSNKASWRVSGVVGGSPGGNDPDPPVLAPVLVNEVLTHTDPPQRDAIELWNPTAQTVDLGGWFLTDDLASPKKYRIPDDTTISPGGYLVFDENQFNPAPGLGGSFAFSSKGDEAYLFSGNASSNLTGYFHGFDFGAAANGVSFGRYLNSVGDEHFVAQVARSLGATNAGPLVGPMVINEIMYRPRDLFVGTNRVDNSRDEYIQLYNITGDPVALSDLNHPSNTWKLREAVSFDFPPGVTVPAQGYVYVVNFDPASAGQLTAFRAQFGIDPSLPVYGPFGGKLDNSGERVELARPDTPEPATGEVPFILVDKVKYSDSAPWPASADGSGAVLRRINPAAYGNDPVNWMAVPVTRPSIAMQPQSLTRTNGNSATFSVTAIGDSTLRYQWRRDGTNIVGATNASLTVNNVQQENGIYAFSFTVVVTDIVGSISSAPAILTVLVNPVITQHPQSVTLAVGANTTLTVTATGTTPFGYRWRRNGVTYSSREGISSLTLENVQATNSGTWTVVVTNIANSTGVLSTNAYLTVVIPPTNQVVSLGSDATFNVSATGTTTPLPIRYLWQFNGITIPGATNKSLIVSNAQPADQGAYAVLVYNAFGTPTLFSAELSLTEAPLILSDSMILPTGVFQARLQGNSNRNYVIEISTNLKDWSALMTLFYTNGLMPFIDTSVTNAANRFYRARVAGQGGLKKLD